MNNDLIHVNTLPPFKRLCMTIGELPTSYLETMTYYEMLVWFTEYMKNTVIPTINNNGEAVEELQEKYIELKSFVDNYFENLDVQEEINNKLDAMAESGELTDIIAQYLGLAGILVFDTVASMKAAENLVNGSTVRTCGFYSTYDTGGNFYKIREISNSDTIDNIILFAITNSNTLVAELIPSGVMNISQFGAKSDAEEDDSGVINTAISYCINKDIKLIINKDLYVEDEITISGSITIDGNHNKITYSGTNYNDEFIVIDTDVEDVTIENLELDGNSKAKVGIWCKNNKNVLIENCVIKNMSDETHGGFGVLIYGNQNINVKNNIIKNILSHDSGVGAGDGIAIEFANDCIISDNTIDTCGRHNISVYGLGHNSFTNQNAIKILNNTLMNSYLAGIDSEAGENILIDGNTFINNGGVLNNNLASSICVKGDGAYLSNKIIITNNNIKTGANTTHALHIDNTCNDIIIDSNIIDSTTDVFNMFAGSGAIKVIISNNYIKNGTNVFKHYHSTYQSYVIVNNIIESCTNLIQGSTIGCKVEGNLCLSCTNVFSGAMKFQESTFDNNRVTFSGEFITNYLNYSKTTIRDNSIIYTGETNIPLLTKSGFSGTDKYTIVTGNIITGDITHVIANYEKTTFDDDMNGNTFYQSYYNNNFLINS